MLINDVFGQIRIEKDHMNWARPSLSHHCIEATMSVVALCNTELESPHLLAIGGNMGNVDIVNLETRTMISSHSTLHSNNILDIAFYKPGHVLSFDKEQFLHLDIETSNRIEILGEADPVSSFTFYGENSPVYASAMNHIYACDLRINPVVLMEKKEVTELCLLPDLVTLVGLQFGSLVMTDVRNPTKFHSLSIAKSFEKISCNENYLCAVTNRPDLYCFELPLCRDVMKEVISYDTPFISKPAFFGDYALIGDSTGTILVMDMASDNCDLLQIPTNEPIVSLAGNCSEIVAAMEDEICVFSSFPFEDNLVREYEDPFAFMEEEENRENWLQQPDVISVEDGECTYERYGYCEQQVFVCFTCVHDMSNPFGICEQCAQICHNGHDVRAIGNRRRFRCDCGNNKSHHPCATMPAPKTCENPRNRYGHNFHERWCVCDGPDNKDEPMVQCICCDDWFHHRCIGMFTENRCLILECTPELDDWVFVCNDCLDSRLTFINEYPNGDVPETIADFVQELQRDSCIAPSGNPALEGVGFSILGGRWISKVQFASFAGHEEYDAEFGEMDTTEEDRGLPLAAGQADFAQVFKDLYVGLFKRMEESGRRVVQNSDVQEALRGAVGRAMQQRRDED